MRTAIKPDLKKLHAGIERTIRDLDYLLEMLEGGNARDALNDLPDVIDHLVELRNENFKKPTKRRTPR